MQYDYHSIQLWYFRTIYGGHDPSGNRTVDLPAKDSIFKLLRTPGIDSKESIPPAYLARRDVTTTIFLLGSQTQ